MPAKSKSQFRYINMLRRRYGDESGTPEEHKWVWEGDWTEGLNYKKLPDAVEKEAGLTAAELASLRETLGKIMPIVRRGGKIEGMDAELRELDVMGGASVRHVSPLMWNKVPGLREQFKRPPTLRTLWKFLETSKADAPITPPTVVPPAPPQPEQMRLDL